MCNDITRDRTRINLVAFTIHLRLSLIRVLCVSSSDHAKLSLVLLCHNAIIAGVFSAGCRG